MTPSHRNLLSYLTAICQHLAEKRHEGLRRRAPSLASAVSASGSSQASARPTTLTLPRSQIEPRTEHHTDSSQASLRARWDARGRVDGLRRVGPKANSLLSSRARSPQTCSCPRTSCPESNFLKGSWPWLRVWVQNARPPITAYNSLGPRCGSWIFRKRTSRSFRSVPASSTCPFSLSPAKTLSTSSLSGASVELIVCWSLHCT